MKNKKENVKNKISIEDLELDQLEAEMKRVKEKRRLVSALRGTIGELLVIAAIIALAALLWLPVLQIYGTSMMPTINSGEYVVSLKGSKFDRGDIVAFYYGNKILVKRYIAGPGEWVNIDDDGNVYVNNSLLDEPYVFEKAKGECDLVFPYQIPEERYFLLGDHGETSVDSRSNSVGCVADENMVGRVIFKIWPISRIGIIK